MVNLILCGGSGTRLWPLSRQMFPKQFVPIAGKSSLFQQTLKRNSSFCDKFSIVTNVDHHFLARHQSEELLKTEFAVDYFLEPFGRNTAPAIALSCFNYSEEEIIFVTPSDHMIAKNDVYAERVSAAIKCAEGGDLVTFGIKPVYPETGYGYIQADASRAFFDGVYDVISFEEKPDRSKAEEYIRSGNYFWNSGMFVFKAGVFLEELKKFSPDVYDKSFVTFQNSKRDDKDSSVMRFASVHMKEIPSISVDYAVMEKSDRVKVVKSDMGWSDLGSFDSVSEILPKDSDGNSYEGNVVSINSRNNLVFSARRKVSMIGVLDLIVVDTPDALCVIRKGESQQVKEAVSILQSGGDDADLTMYHSTVHRPWGTYTVLEESDRYKIKKIVVKPGKRISLQKHLHRSEHWVVVSGTANVHSAGDDKVVCKNESIYIPIGVNHRLANEGKIDLVIIETQVGEYVGEDDIIRIDDDFSRC